MATRCRLAVLASHPIQYFTPLYRRLAGHPQIDIEVWFCRDFGVRRTYDKQFGQAIQWDTDLLAGYPYRFLRNLSPIRDTFNPLHAVNPGAFFRLLAGFDAVWMNGYAYPSNWFAAGAARLRKTRILWRSDMRLDPARSHRRTDWLRDRVIRHWIRASDALLYIGQANKAAYIAYGASPQQLFFAPFSVDVDRIEAVCRASAGDRGALRRKWGVPATAQVALFVGKLLPRKHPEALLQLARQSSGLADLHIVFAGSGPMEGSLRAEAQRAGIANVSFLGFVNQEQLPEVYALADLFVFPSEGEPWGLVLNEAMAAGLVPVVAENVGAAPDLITPGETGFTFPDRDWQTMSDVVLRLLRDAGERARVAAQAQARARQYSYDATVRGIAGALESLGVLVSASERTVASAGEMRAERRTLSTK
jgi:glycosyltransferase involved in cell wall biosynthesis